MKIASEITRALEADLHRLESEMKRNADDYVILCERYIEVSKRLKEMRAFVATVSATKTD